MVVVKIELWPGGDESQARGLGRIEIANDGTGNAEVGNYHADLSHSGMYFGKPGVYRRGRVLNFNRKLSPYHLLFLALKSALRIG